MTEAKTEAHRVRLAGIVDGHLEQLERLPMSDRLAVAATLLGSLIMEIEDPQQLPVFEALADKIRESVTTGGTDE